MCSIRLELAVQAKGPSTRFDSKPYAVWHLRGRGSIQHLQLGTKVQTVHGQQR